MTVPEYAKDVMVAVIGASVALGGLLLVFCGFIFAQAASFPKATTDDTVITQYRSAALLGIWPFLGAIVNALTVLVWFCWPCPSLYFTSLGFFAVLLVVTGVYGFAVTRRYL
jgi:hypothetical protein